MHDILWSKFAVIYREIVGEVWWYNKIIGILEYYDCGDLVNQYHVVSRGVMSAS